MSADFEKAMGAEGGGGWGLSVHRELVQHFTGSMALSIG